MWYFDDSQTNEQIIFLKHIAGHKEKCFVDMFLKQLSVCDLEKCFYQKDTIVSVLCPDTTSCEYRRCLLLISVMGFKIDYRQLKKLNFHWFHFLPIKH